MGNMFEGQNCCAPDVRKAGSDKRASISREQKVPSSSVIVGGNTVSTSYMEWEEIIAFSRAITPGGKLLGLSSTKKMLCTLHRSNALDVDENVVSDDFDHMIKVWDINRVVATKNPHLSKRGTWNTQQRDDQNEKDDGAVFSSTRGEKVASIDDVGKPKVTEVASLLLPVGALANDIVFLDSANPQFIAASVEIAEDSNRRHEVWIWVLKPNPRRSAQREESPEPRHASTRVSHRLPRSKSVSNIGEAAKLSMSSDSLDSEAVGSRASRGGRNNPPDSKGHNVSLEHVCTLKLDGNGISTASRLRETMSTPNDRPSPPGSFGQGTARHATLNENAESAPSAQITTITTLRDFFFAGDDEGRIFAWVWKNWYQADWRRVNRRRRRASWAMNREPLTPSIESLCVCVEGKADNLVHSSVQGKGVTCLHIAHARSGMELYSAGRDDMLRIWSADNSLGLTLMHAINLRDYGICKPRCLNVSQTPDVGAAWYAASHGFHAAPVLKEADGLVNPTEAKRLKRIRGSRNTLPPKLFVAGRLCTNAFGEKLDDGKRSKHTNNASFAGLAVRDGNMDAPMDDNSTCLSPSSSTSTGVGTSSKSMYIIQTFDISKVRNAGEGGTFESAGVRYAGHSTPITTLSYGPYNNGPLTSMCIGGEIKIWPTTMSNRKSSFSNNGSAIFDMVEHATHTFTSWAEESNSKEVQEKGRLSIFASAVQPNDHVWAVGEEHIRAWTLV